MASSRSLTSNALWLGADRVLRLGLSFVVQVLVVRHLGPAGNGMLQGGLALAALAAALVELGLDGMLRRELVRTPEHAGALLGTATTLRLLAFFPAALAYCWAALHQPETTPALMAWLAVTIALPLALTPEPWLLANGRVPANVIAQGAGFLAGAGARLAFVLAGAGVMAFGAAAALETMVIAAALGLAFFSTAGAARRWSWDPGCARRLLGGGTPLLLTTVAILVYRRMDVVLLGNLLDQRAAGLYAAAVRLSEIGYLAPMILLNAWFPRLTDLHATDPAAYRVALADFFRRVTWSAAAFALALTIGAPWIVRLLFGPAFAGAATPLAIHAWTAVFIAHGVARSQWLLLENQLFAGLGLACIGAATNLALNFVLVPWLGVAGAALAAVLGLAFNMGIVPALLPETRAGWALGWKATFSRAAGARDGSHGN